MKWLKFIGECLFAFFLPWAYSYRLKMAIRRANKGEVPKIVPSQYGSAKGKKQLAEDELATELEVLLSGGKIGIPEFKDIARIVIGMGYRKK